MRRTIRCCSVLLLLVFPALAAPKTQKAAPPAPPLAAPQLMHPSAGGYLDLASAVSWRPVEGAQSYSIDVCADAACSRVVDHAANVTRTYWQPSIPRVGSYFWRVTANSSSRGNASSTVTPFGVALTIRGSVFDDPRAIALRQNFTPLAGVRVRVYREGVTAQPAASLTTNAAGLYEFHTNDPGVYWVAVDSKSIRVPGSDRVWAQQTYAPPGGICTKLDGKLYERTPAGACFGGRTIGTSMDASDDASSFATSKHVARIDLQDTSTDVDFGFSFNAVTSLEDYDSDDRPVQGSLRQFVVNANAVDGPNEMRFVPLVRAVEAKSKNLIGVAPQWWTIALRRPLPELRDAGTAIDGTAYSFVAPNSPLAANRGRVGTDQAPTARTVGDVERRLSPELELVTPGEEGLVCTGDCTVRHIALHGAASSIVIRTAIATIEHAIVGAHADATAVGKTGTAGIQLERGLTSVHDVYVADQRTGGIVAATVDAHVRAERVEITRCGEPQGGAGIVLLSDDSTIRASLLEQNFGAGIVLGVPTGGPAVKRNLIDTCTISGNAFGIVLSPGASENQISSNVVMWNRFGGIVVAPFESTAVPSRNRLEANRFNENGGRPIALDPKHPEYESMPESASCERRPAQANGGVAPPHITSVRLQRDDQDRETIVVQGETCPGRTVQLYQSYATTAIRAGTSPVTKIHGTESDGKEKETIVASAHEILPSIGEFNPILAAATSADGKFQFVVPVLRTAKESPKPRRDQEFEFRFADFAVINPADTAFTALAIDPEGNTSELGLRHLVER
jgi:parallel beta-helix repeat protein